MKKQSKVISIILSVVMILTLVPISASADAINEEQISTIDALIETDNINALVEYLINGLNNQKENVTGTILKLAFLMLGNSELTDQAEDAVGGIIDGNENIGSDVEEGVDMALTMVRALQEVIGDQKVVKNSAEQNATVAINWLNKVLPVVMAEVMSEDDLKLISDLSKLLGMTIDLDDVDGILKTLETLNNIIHNKVLGVDADTYGTLEKLNFDAIKGVRTGTDADNLNVIYSFIQFLADNIPVIKIALKGELTLGILDSGLKTAGMDINEVNNNIKESISNFTSYFHKNTRRIEN